jgi:hypothetical protein
MSLPKNLSAQDLPFSILFFYYFERTFSILCLLCSTADGYAFHLKFLFQIMEFNLRGKLC